MDVLVPFDLTAASERALDHAIAAYGPRADVTIHAVHFGDSPEQVESIATAAVEDIAVDVAATVETRFESIDRGQRDDAASIATRILDVAGEVDPAAIVVGRHEKGTVEAWFGGNVADHLIEDGSYPVCVVP